jgi:hypothetical protein
VVVKKPIFFFHTSDLEDMYPGGSVESAKIYLKGSCSGQSYMEDNDYINFYEIGEVDASPTCRSNLDADVRDTISVLMTKTSCDYSGGDWRTITDNFAAAVNNQSNLSFKIDISPARGDDDAPTTSFSYNINDNKLEIEYYFTCTSSNNCPETQYCEDLTTDLCELDLDYGDDCEDVAVDDDDYACENENCQYDDFDGSGHYCTEDNKCLHNGDRFNNGYIHCADDDSYTKTCQGTTWSSSTACSYGCDEGTGCATTTTTSSTTTTLAPDISINPGSLTFRRYV